MPLLEGRPILLKRNLPLFRFTLEWDGVDVYLNPHGRDGGKLYCGEANGLRVATELMQEQEQSLHKAAQGMEMPRR